MTAKFSREIELAAPAERVLALISDPDFQRQKALDFGALEARCHQTEIDDNTVEVVLEERSNPKWGQSQRTTLTIRWDKAALRSRWVRVIHGHEKRSRSDGGSRLIPSADGESCTFVMEGEVEVRVPVLGKKIERKVVEEIAAGRERERAYLNQKLGIAR